MQVVMAHTLKEKKETFRADTQICPFQMDGYSALQEENAYAFMGQAGLPGDYVEKFSVGRRILDDSAPLPIPRHDDFQRMRRSLELYYRACHGIASRLTEVLAVAAGVDRSFFLKHMQDSYDFLRCQNYPIPPEEVQSFAPHLDPGLLTLLTATEPGLEVKMPDGGWHLVEAGPTDVIVNIGDLMARWTNATWKSTEHRVVLRGSPRMSMAFFKEVDLDATISTMESFCMDAPSKYAPIVYSTWMSRITDALYGIDDAISTGEEGIGIVS